MTNKTASMKLAQVIASKQYARTMPGTISNVHTVNNSISPDPAKKKWWDLIKERNAEVKNS